MTIKGHQSSLILAPTETAYATSYWYSIVTLVLSCPVSELLYAENQNFWCALWSRSTLGSAESKHPRL